MAEWDDILFIVKSKSSNECKICGNEFNEENFYPYRRDLCKSCFSKEANFSRIRKVLIRAFKELKVDKNTAIKILQRERNRIYRKLTTRPEEKIVVI
jgi:recombinational DNA repair protein (RecF pathway)